MSKTETWQDVRATGIGASEIGTVIGVSPFGTPFQLFSRKLGLIADITETPRMRAGKVLEPAIRDWYAEETGRASLDAFASDSFDLVWEGEEGTTLRSKDHPWMFATPDGIIMDEDKGMGILEIKVSSFAWSDGIPLHYRYQMQQQMAVCGCAWGAIAALVNGELTHCDIERDEEMIAEIIEKGAEFWQRVQDNDPPELTSKDKGAVTETYRQDDGSEIDLADDAIELDETIANLKSTEKDLKARREEAEAKLYAMIGPAKVATLPNGVRWTTTTIPEKEMTRTPVYTRKASRRYYRKVPKS